MATAAKPTIVRAWDLNGRIVAEARRPDPESPTGFVIDFVAFDPAANQMVRDDTLWDALTSRSQGDLMEIPLSDLRRRCDERAAEASNARPLGC